jgi:NAD dependent epimerase/dehydratase family enzyme
MLRSAMTMSPDRGGVFDYLLWLVRLGLGGAAGSGKQYISWIHDVDFINAIDFIIGNESLSGAVNLASPNPLPNAEFMHALRDVWGQRFGLPASEWMIELGAIFLRTESELVLKSRRVVPSRLLDAGFRFEYPNWTDAARNLCERRKREV